MYDPIIAEVHEARRKLFEEAGCDLHVFFQHLRGGGEATQGTVKGSTAPLAERHRARYPPIRWGSAQRFWRVPSPNPIELSELSE